jgi:hypothetical protein
MDIWSIRLSGLIVEDEANFIPDRRPFPDSRYRSFVVGLRSSDYIFSPGGHIYLSPKVLLFSPLRHVKWLVKFDAVAHKYETVHIYRKHKYIPFLGGRYMLISDGELSILAVTTEFQYRRISRQLMAFGFEVRLHELGFFDGLPIYTSRKDIQSMADKSDSIIPVQDLPSEKMSIPVIIYHPLR